MPHCAGQILCSINQRQTSTDEQTEKKLAFRAGLTKVASFPAAWAISNKSNLNFWSLYSSILDTADNCLVS